MLYFLPTKQSPNYDVLKELGLGYALADCKLQHAQLRPKAGPNQQDGYIVTSGSSVANYDPEKQQWFEHNDGIWFGFAEKPTPKSLECHRFTDGKAVVLGDGQLWTIPVARTWLRDGNESFHYDTTRHSLKFLDGKWVSGEVVEEDSLFDSIGTTIFDHWASWAQSKGDEPLRLPKNAPQLCSDLICLNYRLSAIEVSALGLLNDDAKFLWTILKQVIDIDGRTQIQKKIREDMSSTISG